MSFGKKRVVENKWLDEEELQDRLSQRFEAGRSGTGSSMMAILGGGAVVAVVFAATFYFLNMTPSETADQADASVTESNDDPKPIARAYTKDPDFPDIEPDVTKVAFNMVVTETGFDAIDSELHEQCMKPVDPDMARRAEATGKVLMSLEKGSEFVTCTMQIYKNRFCQPFYKKRLAHRLAEFARVNHTLDKSLQHDKELLNDFLNQFGPKVTNASLPELPPILPNDLANEVHKISYFGMLNLKDFGQATNEARALSDYFAKPKEQACG